jgi:hypothetical protein
MTRFIKYHPRSNTYVIEKGFFWKKTLHWTASYCRTGSKVWKNLTVSGRLELGKGSIVQGNVKAEVPLSVQQQKFWVI